MSTTALLLWIWTLLAAKTGANACSIGDLDIGQCSTLIGPDFSNIDCRAEGSTIKCLARCTTGYKFEEEDAGYEFEVSCDTSEGIWSQDSFPKCVESRCDIAEPEHGSMDCDYVGSTRMCNLLCESGYRHSGSHLFLCDMKTGEWKPELPSLNRFPSCIKGRKSCKNMNMPVRGHVSCNTTNGEQRCYPSCPSGFSFVDAIPDVGYYTCIDGKWSPYEIIPACQDGGDDNNAVGEGHFTGIYTNLKAPADLSGVCYTWGQHHYRTFDGTVFRHRGGCQYLLARDFPGRKFQVHVKNDPNCDGSDLKCTREVIIMYGEEELRLKRDENDEPAAYMDGNRLNLPQSVYGLSVERSADYIIVKDYNSNLYVKWDGSEQVWVKVDEEMTDKVVGLCGTFNGICADDFTVLDGDVTDVVTDLSKFANAWMTSTDCVADGSDAYCKWGDEATEEEKLLTGKAIDLCSTLMNTDCKDIVNPNPYFEACKEDACFFKGKRDARCNSMAAYFRECSKKGVHINWRDDCECGVMCPVGMVYDNCGTSCPKTCDGLEYNCEDHHCIDGCHCPADTYLQNGACVTKNECPCMFGGKAYEPKSKVRRDCNQCVCARGKWICTKNTCDGICRTYGDRHYHTFDGAVYNMRVDPDCSYILARSKKSQSIPFEIAIENKKCTSSATGIKKWQTCTRNLVVKVDGGALLLKSGGNVFYKNKEVELPFVKENFAVEDVTNKFQKVTIWNGMTILWDKELRVFIRAKSNMCDAMAGLCGNFNSVQDDDMWAPDGVTHEDVYEFASLWQKNVCKDAPKVDPLLEHSCDTHSINKRGAKDMCGHLRDFKFLACHEVVDYQSYYESCLYDFCNLPTKRVACDIFATYAMDCAKKGVVLKDWRSESTCEVEECPENEVWAECARSCRASCGAIAAEIPCSEECVPGCTCSEGYVRGYDDKCISVFQCPCYFDDEKFMPGESRMLDCNVCECYKGTWQCTDNYCPVEDSCEENEEFVLCKWEKQVTCFAMHLPYEEPKKPERCLSGCQCVEGYVFDELNEVCVLPENCPCVYGGRSYREGEKMKKDCNSCTCSGGLWTCTENQCSSQCRLYGPSHVTTYDGLNYLVSKDCVYTLTENTEDNEHAFEITVENIPCGTLGTTCSKCITLRINPGTPEEDTLILAKGKPVTVTKGSSYSTRYAGLYVFVDTNIGISIQWDKGTHVIVKLTAEHSRKVRGLCGDFDNNSGNDLIHKDDTPTNDRMEIIRSWQTTTCPAGVDLTEVDTCASNPHRKAWAEARCGVIKTTFKECHAHVPPDPYYQRCVFDTCACDTGGDCECFCTAVAAYANECNKKGVHVYWRTREMCPMQCDGYRVYDPCESACPITCENYHYAWKVEAECQDSCVEGCACKGDLIYDQKDKCCVDKMDCICTVIGGIAYGEGDKVWSMSDECKSCYCMDHEVQCLGLPCPEKITPPELPCTIRYWQPRLSKKKYNPFKLKPSEEECNNEIEKATETCPEEIRDTCGYRCNQLCHSWSAATYQCLHGTEDACCLTCGETIKQCPTGEVLRDDLTCIKAQECTCVLPNGNILAPGDNWDCRVTCTRYYCWNNVLETSALHACKPELELLPVAFEEEVVLVDTGSYSSYTANAVDYEKEDKIDEPEMSIQDSTVSENIIKEAIGDIFQQDQFKIFDEIDDYVPGFSTEIVTSVPALTSTDNMIVEGDDVTDSGMYTDQIGGKQIDVNVMNSDSENIIAACEHTKLHIPYRSAYISADESGINQGTEPSISTIFISNGKQSNDKLKRIPISDIDLPYFETDNFDNGITTVNDGYGTQSVVNNLDSQILKDLLNSFGDLDSESKPAALAQTFYTPQQAGGVVPDIAPCGSLAGIFASGGVTADKPNNAYFGYDYSSVPCYDENDKTIIAIAETDSALPTQQQIDGLPYARNPYGYGRGNNFPSIDSIPYPASNQLRQPISAGYGLYGQPGSGYHGPAVSDAGPVVSAAPTIVISDEVGSSDDRVRVPFSNNGVPCFGSDNNFGNGIVTGNDGYGTQSVVNNLDSQILKDLLNSFGDLDSESKPDALAQTFYTSQQAGGVVPDIAPRESFGGIFTSGEAIIGNSLKDLVGFEYIPVSGLKDEDQTIISVSKNSLLPISTGHPISLGISEIQSDNSRVCPGVTNVPDDLFCSNNFAYDGSKCVPVEDCPCVYQDIKRKTGSVWKEENGCVNCICINGFAKCSPQACEITSCESGYVLHQSEDSCCPTCVQLDSTCLDGSKKIGEIWTEGCNTCLCTQLGTECEPMECPATTVPVCGAGYQLVQKVSGCCPTKECVCDMSLCPLEIPECPIHYKSVPVSSDGVCCPEHQCVCQPDSCPTTFCLQNEIRVYKESDGCCSTYICERRGCLDTAGGWRNVGDDFTCPSNPCTTCTCTAHNVLSCSATSCPVSEETRCASGATPTEVSSEDGCCLTYTCDCYCGGIDLSWNTFDQKYISSGDLGSALLVEDSSTNEFKIYITKIQCGYLSCVDFLELHDNVASNVLKITSDGKVYIDGAEVRIANSDTLRKKGFKITKDISNKLIVDMLSTGVHVTLSEKGRSWSVTAPTIYRGRTAGLCGLCDGVKENDFWDGHKIVETAEDFVSAFGVDLVTNAIVIPEKTEVHTKLCYQSLEIFSSCPVDKEIYINACITDLSTGGSSCDVYAELAAACRKAGHCIEWRTGSLCPFTCSSNMEYRACGSSTLRTCENYKEFSKVEGTFDVEGCFCPDDMVFIDGVCSRSIECPIYTDEVGETHCAGDIWISHSDACTVVTTTSDGTLVQTPVICPEEKTCGYDETKVQVGGDDCCTTYECIPTEKCQDVICPTYDVYTCVAGEEVQAIVHNECCVEMKCVCNKASCPVLPDPTCEDGEILVTKSSACCSTKVCECHAEQCAIPTCTGEGYHLAVVSSGRCCPVYECICDRSYCSETKKPICAIGETAQPKRTSECCVAYECVCDESTCPSAIEYCPTGYKVKKTITKDACCKEIVECECDETACPALQDISCDATAGYKLITTMTPRFSYSLPGCCPAQFEQICVCDSSLCPVAKEPICGKYESVVYEQTSACCTTPQCACDVAKCDAGSTWCPANKHATVTLVDNCCEQVVCECNECQAPCECKAEWIVTEVNDDCGCVVRTCDPPQLCVYNGEQHEPGSSWSEDICVECTCSSSPNSLGEYEAECRDIKCGTCSSGFTYVPVAGSCCGDCVPITCHYDGTQFAVGQSWAPDDNLCKTCTCEMNADTGEVFTTCVDTTCPPIDPTCPADRILTTPDGCCTYCDPTRTIPSECSPTEALGTYLEFEGCTSTEQVSLATCTGSCVSTSSYSVESGNFTKSCSCCTATASEDVEVHLNCPDGSVITKKYKTATQCACHSSVCVEP